MNFFEQIFLCKTDEEVDKLIASRIDELNNREDKPGTLGFQNGFDTNVVFSGFIPLDTRIRYSKFNVSSYSMKSTDFIYDFIHLLRKYNIKTKGAAARYLEAYINSYFGLYGPSNNQDRDYIFDTIAFNSTKTDDEYFEALENNKISDLKGTRSAECTERSALAQQVLSVLGIQSYYCMGCVDRSQKQEGHCFNIVKKQNGYMVIDYSLPAYMYDQEGKFIGYDAFTGNLSNEEFEEFINNKVIKEFDEYKMIKGKGKEVLDSKRRYVVGAFEMEKDPNGLHL